MKINLTNGTEMELSEFINDNPDAVYLDANGDDAANGDGVDEGDTGGAADGDGGDGARQQHPVSEGEKRKRAGL